MALVDNCEAYFEFNGSSADATGNGHDGTDNINLSYVSAAPLGGAAYNSASNDAGIVLGSPVITGTAWSMELWITPDADPNAQAVWSSYGILAGQDAANALYLHQAGSGNPLTVELWVGNVLKNSAVIVGGVQSHVVVACDGTDVRMYVNGVLISTVATAPSWSVSYILAGSAGTYPAKAALPKAGIWTGRALSGAEALELFNSGAGLAYPFVTAPPPAFGETPVTPAFGPSEGGIEAYVSGSGFQPGAVLTIGGNVATILNVAEDEIIFTVPPGTGVDDIELTNPDAQSATAPAAFTYYPAPSIVGVTPAAAPAGTEIRLDFTAPGVVSPTVTVGGVPVVAVDSGSEFFSFIAPADLYGEQTIVVTDTWGRSGTAALTFPASPFTRYGSHLAALLPPGAVWNLERNSTLRLLLAGIGDELDRVEARGADLLEESDPRTATETIADWERILSLPDERVPTISAVLAERRVAVVQKLVGRGGQSYAFFEVLCAACGWPLNTINLFPVLREGFRVDDRCFDSTFAYSMEVVVDPPGPGALTSTQFEAVIRSRTHAHIQVMFTYL